MHDWTQYFDKLNTSDNTFRGQIGGLATQARHLAPTSDIHLTSLVPNQMADEELHTVMRNVREVASIQHASEAHLRTI